MTEKFKILLAGGHDTNNLGDHGSLEVLQRDLRKQIPESEIVLLSRHPDHKFDKLYKIRSILNLDHPNKKESLGRWFKGLNPGDDTSALHEILREFLSADLLVIGNGRLFIDISLDFMRGPLSYFALLVTLAKFTGVPIMIFSMTIVPVKTQMGAELLKYIVSNSDLITVREKPSRKELTKLGIPEEKINVIPDAGFGLHYVDRKNEGKELLKSEGLDPDSRFIGVNFRYTHLGYSVDDEYFASLARLCDNLYEHLGVDLLLIAQMTYGIDNIYDDDREIYKLILKECKNKSHVHVLTRRYNVFETLSIYQCCEIVYSMRRHGIIFCATQRVPTFALSGEKNTSYVMNELGTKSYQLAVNEIDNTSIQQLIDAYNHRDEIRSIMEKRIALLQEQTLKYGQLIVDRFTDMDKKE